MLRISLKVLGASQLTLVDGKDGQRLTITRTQGDEITWQALRFGIGEGSKIQVQKTYLGDR